MEQEIKFDYTFQGDKATQYYMNPKGTNFMFKVGEYKISAHSLFFPDEFQVFPILQEQNIKEFIFPATISKQVVEVLIKSFYFKKLSVSVQGAFDLLTISH